MINNSSNIIFTIGHSTRSFPEFLEILRIFNIEVIADVRTIPKSRHNPQFNLEDLKASLENTGIGYIHMEGLGGLRKVNKNSINTAWKNASFRGYADYMQTPDFEKGLRELINIATKKTTVIMCAEAVPWRCHRSLIGDALVIRNFKVDDILNDKKSTTHKLTPWAKVDGAVITYPEEAPKA